LCEQALGTHWGAIHILDFAGNEIKKFNSHSTTVNELDIDASGEYVASCSDDGKVVIHGLYNQEVRADMDG
jgi:tricorn protease-like protein